MSETELKSSSVEAYSPMPLSKSNSASSADLVPTSDEASPAVRRVEKESNNIFSIMTYHWVTDTLTYGYKHNLTDKHLPELKKGNLAETMSERFERAWAKEKDNPNVSMFWVIARSLGAFYLTNFIFGFFWAACALFIPSYLIRTLILYVQTPVVSRDTLTGWLLVLGFLSATNFQALVFHRTVAITILYGLRARCIVTMAVYNKALRLAGVSSTIGEIVNMQSNDAYRVHELFRFAHNPPWTFCIVVVVFALLIVDVGVIPAVVGTVVLVALFVPLQIGITAYVARARRRIARITDQRIRMMSEILSSIKLVKLYSWEKSFAAKIAAIRRRETSSLFPLQFMKLLMSLVQFIVPSVAIFAIFVTYTLLGNTLDPPLVFTVTSLVEATRYFFDFFTLSARSFGEGMVGLKRLRWFMLLPEVDDKRQLEPDAAKPYIKIEGASFKWPEGSKPEESTKLDAIETPGASKSHLSRTYALSEIDLEVKAGELLAIVGPVGSGKTSLLAAIVGQIPLVEGAIKVGGSLAYATQQAWIMNDTMRDNILFGKDFDQRRYERALRSCQLAPDLHQLPAGDLTEIGERGINLSGGQKQRVALARVVYSDRAIVCLDDPLSAVDQHVGRRIFDDCIRGALKGKTILFVTNQLQYLPKCDRVIVMKRGEISAMGTYAELVSKKVDFSITEGRKESRLKKSEERRRQSKDPRKRERKERHLRRKEAAAAIPFEEFARKRAQGKIVSVEDRETGNVKAQVYLDYARSGGSLFFAVVVFALFALSHAARTMPDIWLAWWSQQRYGSHRLCRSGLTAFYSLSSPLFYVYVMSGLTAAMVMSMIVRNVMLAKFTNVASKGLHNAVFNVRHRLLFLSSYQCQSVVAAPMKFFDATPVGRILNRFSKDLDSVDDTFASLVSNFIHSAMGALTSIIVVSIFLPYYLIAVAVIGVFFFLASRWFRNSSRELKRTDGVTRSPIFAHLSATLTGLATIRGFGAQSQFIRDNERRIDRNMAASFYLEFVHRWLAYRLDVLVAFLVTATAVIVINSDISPSIAGLSVLYAINTNLWFAQTVRSFADFESQFTSAERLLYYAKRLPSEAPSRVPETEPDSSWPAKGEIAFKDVTVHYNPGNAPVLTDVSFTLPPAEKVGIVGRTGAGKSTLVVALFRLLEVTSGTIEIDGVDISKIGLYDLRSKLGIIPQDPVLFTGSIRANLDPFEEHSDDEIWRVLEKVNLKEAIVALPGHLESIVAENGENFSVGQRQLLCIGRALLRNSKILVLDEATASIDVKTDKLIQETIRKSFKRCTVLTIAHRLWTIIDSDRILLLDRGKLVENGSPHRLLKNGNSHFSKLVAETGATEAAKLKKIARNARKRERKK